MRLCGLGWRCLPCCSTETIPPRNPADERGRQTGSENSFPAGERSPTRSVMFFSLDRLRNRPEWNGTPTSSPWRSGGQRALPVLAVLQIYQITPVFREILPGLSCDRRPTPTADVQMPGKRSLLKKAYVALLRGVNVGGNNKVPKGPLEELCAAIGWTEVRTHLQTGNIVFSASGDADTLEKRLEQAIHERFGFPITVVIRDAARFKTYVAQVPFAAQTVADPSHVLLYFTKLPPRADAAKVITSLARAEEAVVAAGGVLWIYFPNGIGSSKLSPAVIDRAVGSTATGRNWNTVSKIQQLCSQ